MAAKTQLFDMRSRTGEDSCAHAVEDDQNQNVFDYTTYNYFNRDISALIDFASDHPNLRFVDGINGLASPQTIDQDSVFRNEQGWTPRGVQQLAVRTYQAAPDMTIGGVLDTKGEEAVAWGDVTCNRGTALSGVFLEGQFCPMIPSLVNDVQDPSHIVPVWARGGESTRDASRNLAFLNSQGYQRGDRASASGREPPFVRMA